MADEIKEENINDVAMREPPKFLWLKNIFKSTSHKRLNAAIGPFKLELQALIDEKVRKKEETSPWAERSLQMLWHAKQALKFCEIDLGWRYFHQAQLLTTHLLDTRKLRNRAQATLNEAEKKLGPWRKKTVQDLLGKDGELKDNFDANDVYDARKILQEHYSNTYIKLSRALLQLAILVPIAALLVASFIWVVGNFSGQIEITNPFLLLSVAIFGALGGTASGMITNVKGSIKGGIPDQLLVSWLTVSRPIFAAMAALAIAAFLLSGLLQLGDLTFNLIIAISFVAGFSERLLLTAVGKVS